MALITSKKKLYEVVEEIRISKERLVNIKKDIEILLGYVKHNNGRNEDDVMYEVEFSIRSAKFDGLYEPKNVLEFLKNQDVHYRERIDYLEKEIDKITTEYLFPRDLGDIKLSEAGLGGVKWKNKRIELDCLSWNQSFN